MSTKRSASVVLLLSIVFAGAAHADSDATKCQAGLLKARSKYEKCVSNQISKYAANEANTFYARFYRRISRCHIAFDRDWTRLSTRLPGTICDRPSRYADNGDRTITDYLTGLVWEKKSDDGDPLHDKDRAYGWASNVG